MKMTCAIVIYSIIASELIANAVIKILQEELLA